jgi:quinol monooxygenase YgiN
MYVVTVVFDLKPGTFEAFREAIFANAAASRQEQACYQFDVCFSADRARCFLYEVYRDRAAFDFHHETPHFLEFDRVSKPLFASKKVDTYELASGGPAAKG